MSADFAPVTRGDILTYEQCGVEKVCSNSNLDLVGFLLGRIKLEYRQDNGTET